MIPCIGVIALLAAPAVSTADGPEALSARFRDAARRVLPAVVTVRTAPAVTIPIGPPPGLEPQGPSGSGVVVDAEAGWVLSNDHVVRGAGRVIVTLHDGRERVVERIHRDSRSDLALLKISAPGLEAARWGDSEHLDLGDWVLAVGQPFGLADTVTAGIVSGKGRGVGQAVYEDLIQTDAAINPGNSGGPLINLQGEVVGINTAIKTMGGGYEGVGFAVPSSRARRVTEDLLKFGRVRRASIGVLIGRLDPAAVERLGRAGAVPVNAVAALGPAADGDLRPGDVITEVSGRPVQGVGMLQSVIESAEVGAPLELKILRGDQSMTLQVRPVNADEPRGSVPAAPAPVRPGPDAPESPDARNPTRFPELGLRLSEPDPAPAGEAAARGLVVRGVEPGGPADRGGLEIGMVLTDVGGVRVESLADLRAALARRARNSDLVVRILKGTKAEFRVLLDPSRADAADEERTPGRPRSGGNPR